MSEKSSKRLEAIDAQLQYRIDDLERVLNSLVQMELVGCKKKISKNYWIRAGEAAILLRKHGYEIPIGNVHRLQ